MADAWTEGSPMKIRVIVFLIAAFVCNGHAIAGTTGSISGIVTTSAGTPVAAARVTVISPSQTSSVVTDASGHFTLLSLAPDTYTLTVVKSGFETAATTGISVFADQSQTLRLSMQPTLR